jgi:hypothetical protein
MLACAVDLTFNEPGPAIELPDYFPSLLMFSALYEYPDLAAGHF